MKKPKSFSEAIARELNPELHQPRQKSRGIRPSDNEIATALRATNGLFAQAAQRLLVSERSLRRWVSESEELTQLVESERELIIDLAELTIIRILKDEKHHRNFDAAKLLLQSIGSSRGYGWRVHHTNQSQVEVKLDIPAIGERDFTPELFDPDQAHRFHILSEKPVQTLSAAELNELKELYRIADKSNLVELADLRDDDE